MAQIILPQIVSIGIFNSDIAIKNKTTTSVRKTTMFEIDLPIENGGIVYVDSEQSPIIPNTVICVKPGHQRHTRLPYKCYYIHMILEEGALYDMLMKTPSFIPITNFPEYLYLFKSLCNHRDSETESNAVILQSLILQLVYMLNKDSQKLEYTMKLKNLEHDIVEEAIKYIKEHLSGDLSLDAVSKFASYSPIHFHNCFKAATGTTLHEYVENLRIKKSMVLLSTTSQTLAEIALQCGFSSQSYFNYVFKRRTNMTPREYAKKECTRYLYESTSRTEGVLIVPQGTLS
ncbi:MAG: helix-turn-helix transcriptional regulator [Clostridia bacterium]|nr:helix-turn-helix transcriptional regulator [Clostridia bacterium]